MTTRERRERKAEQLRGWAEKREVQARAVLSSQPELRRDWAFITQPGHIPERARMNARDARAHESLDKARGMRDRAAGIGQQLDRAIYSDDPDAVEAIEGRIAELEQSAERMKAVNAAWRKAKCKTREETAAWLVSCELLSRDEKFGIAKGIGLHWKANPPPFESYQLSNLGGNIRRLRERIVAGRARAAEVQRAEAAGGVMLTEAGHGYCTVTFAEKPERAILEALRAAGFAWVGGSWGGYSVKLPEGVRALLASLNDPMVST